MNKQKPRETIDSLLPFKHIDEYLKERAGNVSRMRCDRNDHAKKTNQNPEP